MQKLLLDRFESSTMYGVCSGVSFFMDYLYQTPRPHLPSMNLFALNILGSKALILLPKVFLSFHNRH